MASVNPFPRSTLPWKESAKGIVGVSESSVQLTGNVNDIQSEASDNNGIAEELATEVGKFKLE